MNFPKLLQAMTFDALLAACFYLYLVQGIPGAKTFIDVVLWFTVACRAIVVFSGRAAACDRNPPLNAAYVSVSTLFILLALIWAGEHVLPAVLFISSALFTSLRGKKA